MIGKTYANGTVTGNVREGESSQGKSRYEVETKLETGELVHVYLYTSPDAIKYTAEKLCRLGWSGKGDVGSQIKGKPCRVCIKVEEFQGKETAPKYDFVRSDYAAKPVSADGKASMQAALEAAARDAGDFPPPPAATAAAPKKPDLF